MGTFKQNSGSRDFADKIGGQLTQFCWWHVNNRFGAFPNISKTGEYLWNPKALKRFFHPIIVEKDQLTIPRTILYLRLVKFGKRVRNSLNRSRKTTSLYTRPQWNTSKSVWIITFTFHFTGLHKISPPTHIPHPWTMPPTPYLHSNTTSLDLILSRYSESLYCKISTSCCPGKYASNM